MKLTVVRSGRFSGSAPSLVTALSQKMTVTDIDVMPLAREVSMMPSRLSANVEAMRAGRVPWSKTATWSAAVQRRLELEGHLGSNVPVLFVQSLLAIEPKDELRYVVYTDRVGLEGAAIGGRFGTRFSERWLARERVFLQNAHRILVMGPTTRRVLIDDYRMNPERVIVAGAGPNCELGPPALRPVCRRFIFVGTQWELKGGQTLLEAFSLLRKRVADVELLVVGSEPTGAVPSGVNVVGRVAHADMDSLYSQADALVVPTHMEAFGISILEALLKGLPCIGTTVGNQPFLIGDAGHCVEPGDAESLFAAMWDLMLNYDTYRVRADRRRSILLKTMGWSRVADQVVENLYSET